MKKDEALNLLYKISSKLGVRQTSMGIVDVNILSRIEDLLDAERRAANLYDEVVELRQQLREAKGETQEVEMPSFGNLPTETVKLGEPLEAPTGEAKEIEIEHFGGSFNVHGVKDWGEGTYYFREVRGETGAGAAPERGAGR